MTDKHETISVELPDSIIDILKTKAEECDVSLEYYVTEALVRGALKTVTDAIYQPWFVEGGD